MEKEGCEKRSERVINVCGESEFKFVREEKQLDGRVVSPTSLKSLLNEKRMKQK